MPDISIHIEMKIQKHRYLQSHKQQKLSGQRDFCRKNFPDETRKSRQFSNLQQISVKSVFANLRIIWKLSRLSRHISRSSRLFSEYPDTFLVIWKLSSSFQHFLDHIWTLSRSSGNFLVHLDTLHVTWIFCIVSGPFPNYPEILQLKMSLLQKLSAFAKTFRSALLTRWMVFF